MVRNKFDQHLAAATSINAAAMAAAASINAAAMAMATTAGMRHSVAVRQVLLLLLFITTATISTITVSITKTDSVIKTLRNDNNDSI